MTTTTRSRSERKTRRSVHIPADIVRIVPSGGNYGRPFDVTLSTRTPNAIIHYTTDHTEPSAFEPGLHEADPRRQDDARERDRDRAEIEGSRGKNSNRFFFIFDVKRSSPRRDFSR